MTLHSTRRLQRFAPCALLALCAFALRAQDVPAVIATPALPYNPQVALQALAASADAPYQLGRGDAISVDAIGRPELSGKHIIGPDGKVTIPIAGAVEVADLTRDQAAGAIEHALDPYYKEVTVSVGVDRYTSNEIIVLGAVLRPGVINFARTPTLLEAVSRANSGSDSGGASSGDSGGDGNNGGGGGGGGIGGGGGGNGLPGTRSTGIPQEITLYRGNDMRVTIQLRALVEENNPLANMRLRRDDIIYVSGKTSYVSFLGQVNRPGNLHLESTTTLADLLAQAGGPTEKAGRNPTIEILHQVGLNGPSTRRSITFKELREHASIDLTLRSGDILYIPESGFNGASYTFQQLSPLVNLFTVASILGGTNSAF
jgi:polysaccharide export outer membrane protein